MKSRFRLDEINTTDAYIIEALIIMADISLMISRVNVDELFELEAKRRNSDTTDDSRTDLPRRRCSTVIERHAGLVHLYFMLDLGYELPDLDEVPLWAARDPNPHRDRLRDQVVAG